MPINNPVAFYDQAVKYTAVVPRILELNNVAVPTGGQVYQLTGVPSDRPVIAVVHLNPGFSAASFLRVICEPVKTGSQSQIAGVSSWAYLADAVAFFSAAYVSQNRPTLLIPCQAGQIYMSRNGSYSSVDDQTQLWTLGFFEGIGLTL